MMNLLFLIMVNVYTLLQIPMADEFRSDGKIYVVLGVMLILLAGFLYFLWTLEKRIKKLEDKSKGEK